ncbi:Imm10 family immunity protein [Alloalcanivorax profundimaris]|uniref:Imm10 family immunity protein n=1 Tax=Alloalcanivorax profundimaris TaxID=2735259 RepID=UPI0018871547|nr:Imm10 family immunity protein [Alloalcanivorax profundimaris]MBF1803519.1 hypothetical protein [Alloalcanivorax profundimaris]MCQ6261333.1 Imm10 family immunity protein [Alcanivorax sp. MM125-6]
MSDPDHVRFHARSVVLEHPDGFCHLLGFADDPSSPRHYLMLQRDFEHIEAVEEAPAYYLEWCGPEGGGWGGVETVTQTTDSLALTFEAAVARMLGLRALTITFVASEVDAAALSEGLRRIFQGCGARLSLIDPA